MKKIYVIERRTGTDRRKAPRTSFANGTPERRQTSQPRPLLWSPGRPVAPLGQTNLFEH